MRTASGGWVLKGDIVSQIESSIVAFFTSLWQGIQSFFGSIFGSFAQVISQILLAPVNAVNQSFANLGQFSSGLGPLAPLVTVGVTLLVILVVIFVVWLVIKISVSEGEQTAEEAEEGT